MEVLWEITIAFLAAPTPAIAACQGHDCKADCWLATGPHALRALLAKNAKLKKKNQKTPQAGKFQRIIMSQIRYRDSRHAITTHRFVIKVTKGGWWVFLEGGREWGGEGKLEEKSSVGELQQPDQSHEADSKLGDR